LQRAAIAAQGIEQVLRAIQPSLKVWCFHGSAERLQQGPL
jgi:hypothetical protein